MPTAYLGLVIVTAKDKRCSQLYGLFYMLVTPTYPTQLIRLLVLELCALMGEYGRTSRVGPGCSLAAVAAGVCVQLTLGARVWHCLITHTGNCKSTNTLLKLWL